ncbi:sperm acrosome membrane-associated protein 4-like [Latimeria chalumnae]|uniref:sperm acrosome membrane-associated protein 4-like n=1 Tax=Latimeria chalumnae TaxID=7897 RepID=UPI00313A7D4A
MLKLSFLVGATLVLMLCASLGTGLECYKCGLTGSITGSCKSSKVNCSENQDCATLTFDVAGLSITARKQCLDETQCNTKIKDTLFTMEYELTPKCCNTTLCNAGNKVILPAAAFLPPLFLCVWRLF